MGGENWETRWVRSRAGLLQSPRDLHLDLATFGARHSLRNSDTLLALLGTALATLEHIPPKEPWEGQTLQVRYQGAPKGCRNYVENVGLQKLQIQSASLVAIGANPVDFLPTASPSSHHPHRPPGTGQFMGSFSPNVFLLPATFFRKTFSDRKQGASLRGQPVYGGKTFSGKKRPVKRNTFGGKEPIN